MKKIENKIVGILKIEENKMKKVKEILTIKEDALKTDWERWASIDEDGWEWDEDWHRESLNELYAQEDWGRYRKLDDRNYYIPNKYPEPKNMNKIGKNIYFVTAIQYWGIDNKLEYTKLKQNPDNYSLNPHLGGIDENGVPIYGKSVFIDTEENMRKYLLLQALKCDGYLTHLINKKKININLHKKKRISKKYLKKIKNILKKESYIRLKLWENYEYWFPYTFWGENLHDGSLYWRPKYQRDESNIYLRLKESSNFKMDENVAKYDMICIKQNNNYFYINYKGLDICPSRADSLTDYEAFSICHKNKYYKKQQEEKDDIVYEMYYVDKKIELDILENKSKVNGVALKSCPPEEYEFGGAFLDYNTAKEYLSQGSLIKIISADHAILREFCLKKCRKNKNGWEDEIIAYSHIH